MSGHLGTAVSIVKTSISFHAFLIERCIHLFILRTVREGKRKTNTHKERALGSVDFHPIWPQWPRVGQAETRIPESFESHMRVLGPNM